MQDTCTALQVPVRTSKSTAPLRVEIAAGVGEYRRVIHCQHPADMLWLSRYTAPIDLDPWYGIFCKAEASDSPVHVLEKTNLQMHISYTFMHRPMEHVAVR